MRAFREIIQARQAEMEVWGGVKEKRIMERNRAEMTNSREGEKERRRNEEREK